MHVFKPTSFPAPVLCLDDFLHESHAKRIMDEWAYLRAAFTPATVFGDTPPVARQDPSIRVNDALALDTLFRNAPQNSPTLTLLKWRIQDEECRTLWRDGHSILEAVNYANRHEAVVSRYGDGAFYKAHQDTRWDNVANRMVTLVYYLNVEPRRFDGGNLILSDGDKRLAFEPQRNRAVVFPSSVFHEVTPVSMESGAWEDGRFSLNYWLGFN